MKIKLYAALRHVATPALLHAGFAFDRNWLVVKDDGKDVSRFVTQRQIPSLALVAPSLPPEAFVGSTRKDLPPDAALQLTAPGMPTLQVRPQ
jgi:uncharacterized protein YcbX